MLQCVLSKTEECRYPPSGFPLSGARTWLVRTIFSCEEEKHNSNLHEQSGYMLTHIIKKFTEKLSFRHGSIQEYKIMLSGHISHLALSLGPYFFLCCFHSHYAAWVFQVVGEDNCFLIPQIYFPQCSQFWNSGKKSIISVTDPKYLYIWSYDCVQENGEV